MLSRFWHSFAPLGEFISETVKDRGNPSTDYRKLSTQSIEKKNTSKLDEK
jgi:hypothetical protein